MARVPLVSVALILGSAPSLAFDSLLWQRGYQGPGGGENAAAGLVTTPAGETYVAGVSSSLAGTTAAPRSDVLFQKYDAQGNLAWEQVLDLGGNEGANRIVRDATSGALFACGTRAALLPQQSHATAWLVWRLDPATGAVLWQREYEGPNAVGGAARGLAVDALGGVAVTGFVYTQSTSDSDPALVRYGPDGSLTYERVWITPGATFGDVIGTPAALPDGSVVVAGLDDANAHWLRRVSASGAELAALASTTPFGSLRTDASGGVFTLRDGSVHKDDSSLQSVWVVAPAQIFSDGSVPTRLALDPAGSVRVSNGASVVASISAAGAPLWEASVPSIHSLEVSFPRLLEVAGNGDALLAMEGVTMSSREFVSVARFDASGNFRWIQSVIGGSAAPLVNALGLAAGAQDSNVLCGTFGTSATSSDQRGFVAALREQSRRLCFGDGSSGNCPCGNNSNPSLGAGCIGGYTTRLVDFGVASLATDTLTFQTAGIGPLGPSMLLQSQGIGAGVPFQNGLLCLSGPILRLYVGTPTANSHLVPQSGAPSVSARSSAAGSPIAAGSTRYYQTYYRTPPTSCGGATANLSNAVEVRWGL